MGYVPGCSCKRCADEDTRKHLEAQDARIAELEARCQQLAQEREAAIDCHGDPPVCGACITCLNRKLDAAEQAMVGARDYTREPGTVNYRVVRDMLAPLSGASAMAVGTLGHIERIAGRVERLQAEVDVLRGVGCSEGGDGPCGACVKCYQARIAELFALLREVTPPADDWWCPTCREALSGARVTHDERCDTCGTWLGAATPEWVQRARALLILAPAQAPGEPASRKS